MKKSFFIIASLTSMIVLTTAFTNPDEPRFKNLKILPKNITKPQLDSVMNNFTASLGVKCNFCHVRTADKKEWNFPADDNKHKLIAREMLTMTAKINKKYFDVTGKGFNASQIVTCYTCHNGKPEPAVTPPLPPQKNETREKNKTDSTKKQ